MLNSSRKMTLSGSIFKRTLFTDDFLGVAQVRERQRQVLKPLRKNKIQISSMRKDIIDSITSCTANENSKNEKKQVNLLTDDIEKIIMTSRGRKQLEQSTHILRNYALNSSSGVTNVKTNRLSSLMQTLSSLSHYENNMKMMPILLKDDIFLEKLNLSNNMKAKQTHTAILTQYLDFLYEVQKYEKILHEVDILSEKLDNPLPWPILTLAMMSCLRMNTPESYIKATNIYNNLCDSKTRTKSEIAYPYILLTAKQNNLEEAFEILKHKVDKDTKNFRELGTHAELQISLFIQMERLPDAIEVLENIVKLATIDDKPLDLEIGPGEKLIFSFETINSLTRHVEQCDEKCIQVRLASIYKQIDAVAAISEKSLEDLIITGPDIDAFKPMKYKSRKKFTVINKKLKSKHPPMMTIDQENDLEAELTNSEEIVIKT